MEWVRSCDMAARFPAENNYARLPHMKAGLSVQAWIRMNQQERVDLYREYMASKGVDPKTSVPPMWDFLWRLGLEIPPPPFINPAVLALAFIPIGALLPLVLGVLFFLLSAGHRFYWPPWQLMEAIIVGSALLIGLGTPVYYRQLARRCGLGSWSTFIGHRQRPLP